MLSQMARFYFFLWLNNSPLYLTLEQHGFELCRSTYMQISFTKYVLQYCTILGWLNPQMQNCRYERPIVKLYSEFWLHRDWHNPTLMLFKGQLWCHNFCLHSSISGPLGCFYILSIINNAAMNVGMLTSFKLVFSFSG